MRVLEPSGLYSACIQPTPPSPVETSVANSRKLNLNLYKSSSGPSAAEETIHLTTPSGQLLNSIFTESGSTGNRNLLNSNELHLLNSLSNKTNCNGNFSIQVSY